MRKVFTVIAALAVNAAAFAQTIDFKMDYKQNSTYTQKMDMDVMMDIGQEGQGNMEQPLAMAFIYTIKTDKAAANGDIPFTANMKMENDMMPNAEEFNNNKFVGHFSKGAPVFDKVEMASVPAEAQEQLKEAFSKVLSQFPTEAKKVKVGESFTYNNLPVSMGGMDFGGKDMVITYTLKKVEGNKATFDVLLDSPLEVSTQGVNMKGKMKMTGTMIYLTDAKYVPSQDLDIDATFSMAEAGVTVGMKGKTIMTTTVAPN
ncbi:hypothetical protein AM493_18650 [Flavobacterium akiainvivens]|uniref:Lipid/polyisoprenoid-binding YceI-like domain-containing protein n=1 Tax=Flavobacterium akiainvivens TaxID=1202724 RepID=A0A0M8MK51_9FLAO|nr:hypothetical protein [Flavobacterium akiainvivens]KOS07851.1 hypothetical protein AM493_18650 [Flavobacterium akiainvivens]SFQ27527.1 hypothetical protein SAMN05444144_102310 [Flavobacterium akiainvivens]